MRSCRSAKRRSFGGEWDGEILKIPFQGSLRAAGLPRWPIPVASDTLSAADMDRWMARARPGWLQRLLPRDARRSTGQPADVSELLPSRRRRRRLSIDEFALEKLKAEAVARARLLRGLRFQMEEVPGAMGRVALQDERYSFI